jgi:hypothetical protein
LYKAILFAPDGDWVTDFGGCKTKEEVWQYVENMGSRWFFYPFVFVIKDKKKVYTLNSQRIVDMPFHPLYAYYEIQGKSIKTVSNIIANMPFPEKESILGV